MPRREKGAPSTSDDRVAWVPVGSADGSGRKRPARFGLQLRFESRPDDSELGRLFESAVWVNDAHPAYRVSFEPRHGATTGVGPRSRG